MGRGGLLLPAAGSAAVAKSSWPELVGHHLVDAVAVIKSQRPDVFMKLFADGDALPPDFDPHRVCLFLDVNDLTVARTPKIG